MVLVIDLLRQSGAAQQLGKSRVAAKAIPCWTDFEIHIGANCYILNGLFQPRERPILIS